MQLELEHSYRAPLELVGAAILDPAWSTFLVEHSGVLARRKLLSCDDDGRYVTRRIENTPVPAFDRIGPLHLSAELFQFVEHSVWDRAQRTLRFENVPLHADAASRVSNCGEVSLEPVPGGTRRITRTEIVVRRLPLLLRPLASLIEHALVREARRMLEAEARTLALWFARDELALARPEQHLALVSV